MVDTAWSFTIRVNGEDRVVRSNPEKPLLWVLREDVGLLGTKYGCGEGLCGVCTVLVDGVPTRSCQRTISGVESVEITTIEGIGEGELHPVQEAWIREDVSQCGFCQPGQILTAVALARRVPRPSEQETATAMDRVLCRCGTYGRIQKAIRSLLTERQEG
jgi:isoquinoline 1-oxidoreductase alpha subunit